MARLARSTAAQERAAASQVPSSLAPSPDQAVEAQWASDPRTWRSPTPVSRESSCAASAGLWTWRRASGLSRDPIDSATRLCRDQGG